MYEELVKRLHRYSENCVAYKLDADFADAVQQAADAIEKLQADVVPVAHGKWKKRRFTELAFGFECSVCHTTWDASTYFCPNCGAMMEEN